MMEIWWYLAEHSSWKSSQMWPKDMLFLRVLEGPVELPATFRLTWATKPKWDNIQKVHSSPKIHELTWIPPRYSPTLFCALVSNSYFCSIHWRAFKSLAISLTFMPFGCYLAAWTNRDASTAESVWIGALWTSWWQKNPHKSWSQLHLLCRCLHIDPSDRFNQSAGIPSVTAYSTRIVDKCPIRTWCSRYFIFWSADMDVNIEGRTLDFRLIFLCAYSADIQLIVKISPEIFGRIYVFNGLCMWLVPIKFTATAMNTLDVHIQPLIRNSPGCKLL